MQLLWVNYVWPEIFGFPQTVTGAGIIALALQSSGYLAETFRSGFDGLPKGQREAAAAVGMSRWRVLYRIELPPGTIKFKAQPRDASAIKLRFDRGAVGTPALAPEADSFWTLRGVPGQYIESWITAAAGARVLYAESPDAGAVLEIIVAI